MAAIWALGQIDSTHALMANIPAQTAPPNHQTQGWASSNKTGNWAFPLQSDWLLQKEMTSQRIQQQSKTAHVWSQPVPARQWCGMQVGVGWVTLSAHHGKTDMAFLHIKATLPCLVLPATAMLPPSQRHSIDKSKTQQCGVWELGQTIFWRGTITINA